VLGYISTEQTAINKGFLNAVVLMWLMV